MTAAAREVQSYPPEFQIAYRICRAALDRGVWLRPLRDVLVIMPPLSIDTDELDFLGETLLQSIDAVTGELAEQPIGNGGITKT